MARKSLSRDIWFGISHATLNWFKILFFITKSTFLLRSQDECGQCHQMHPQDLSPVSRSLINTWEDLWRPFRLVESSRNIGRIHNKGCAALWRKWKRCFTVRAAGTSDLQLRAYVAVTLVVSSISTDTSELSCCFHGPRWLGRSRSIWATLTCRLHPVTTQSQRLVIKTFVEKYIRFHGFTMPWNVPRNLPFLYLAC